MFDKLIKDLYKDFTDIKISLDASNIKNAKDVLASAAEKLQELINHAEDPIFVEIYEKQLSNAIGVFIEISMKVSFAFVYSLIDAYDKAVSAKDTTQATTILRQVEHETTFMQQSYLDAQRDGRSQTAAFIDFEKDFSYLLKNLEESKKNAVIEQMCTNFANAINFKETKQQFFYWSRSMAIETQPSNTLGESLSLK
ncbi:hypothetical protein [Legionella fallonii]|uniref:Uncharacterized protein n=1 Tax=Legionella fallonii LLAP-10 TaxID=1212491 RepID=A0A098G2K4_9GAMM|nr:hypothetical protein [Legionella fallonii]CEG56219.1 protein of unknown function [Legionella fallonii LLAP-10]